jgi:hypothetical protein
MPHNGSGSNGTGESIAICNGMNTGHCTEAAEVVKHRLRRPGKRAAPGDPDYVDDVAAAPMYAQKRSEGEPVTTESGSAAQFNEL